jgi:hypothetical protein
LKPAVAGKSTVHGDRITCGGKGKENLIAILRYSPFRHY